MAFTKFVPGHSTFKRSQAEENSWIDTWPSGERLFLQAEVPKATIVQELDINISLYIYDSTFQVLKFIDIRG